MKKETIFKITKISSLVIAFFNFMMYFSMRCCWSGISKTLGYEKTNSSFIYNLPLIICIVLAILLAVNIVLFFTMKKEKNIWSLITLGINIVFSAAIVVIIALGAKDYLYFIWPEFFSLALLVFGIWVAVFFLFYYHKTPLKDDPLFKFVMIGGIIITSCCHIFNVSINRFTYKPVVYAVEDTYQIVFSTSTDSLGWVVIDGVEYHQTSAGSQISRTKVHKISVPMEKLDSAKTYSIYSQKLIYRGPFGGIKGREISESYDFAPVNTTDGLKYYSLADIHMELEGSKKATSYHSDMELLVINGDVISMIDTFDDANYVNKVAHEITKGRIPVVYSRGNHEIKGKYSEEFHKFVGSVNGDFFFTAYLGDTYILNLDIGEDHDDDYWEYYDTVNYDEYRAKQLEFVQKEIDSKNYLNYKYRLVLSHIPVVFVNSRKNHVPFKDDLTALLNQMDIDMLLSGHQHDLFVFEPNVVTPKEKLTYNAAFGGKTYKGYLTDFNFPSMLISKRGLTQTDSSALTSNKQIGLAIEVDFNNNKQIATYNNYYGEKVNIVNPFADIDYGNEIEIDLDTKVFSKK